MSCLITKKSVFFILLASGLVFLIGENAPAQMRRSMLNPEQSTYFPYKNPPALSPWLELQRSTQGSNLDSYHQYVKPQMEIEKAMETQQRQLLRQKEAQLQMKQELKERGIQLKYSGTASQTGIQTRFREYGHYYPKKGMVK